MSDYAYPKGYNHNLIHVTSVDALIADMEMQVRVLDRYFNSGMSFDKDWMVKVWMSGQLPSWVEKFFAHIPWQMLAPTYCEAVKKVLAAIEDKWNFSLNTASFPDGLVPEHFRQHEKSVGMFEKLAWRQEYNGRPRKILIVPAQFGIRHKSQSVLEVRDSMHKGEVGLGLFDVGMMILTHPERLQDTGYLGINCPGDECFDGLPRRFTSAPVFARFSEGLRVIRYGINTPYKGYGSASAFLPQ